MRQERALVVSPSSRLIHRAGIEVERSLASRAGRYVMLVTSGTALATMGAIALGLAKHPLSTRLEGASEGQWVRLRGHVLPGPTFTSAGGRTDAVLACYVGELDRLLPSLRATRRWELHGLDFSLAMSGGERVRVSVAGARYLDGPSVVPQERFEKRPLATSTTADGGVQVASVYQEDVVAVGDEVEVLGFLRREVDPTAESGFRGARPIPVLRSHAPWALLIRRALPEGESL